MNLIDFCKYFDFTIQKGKFKDEFDEENKYRAVDDQNYFEDRFGNEPNDFRYAFEGALTHDYVNEILDEYGIPNEEFSKCIEYIDLNNHELKNTDTYHVMKVICNMEDLEDDLKTKGA